MRTAAAAAGNTLALLAVTSAVCLLGAHAQTGVEGGETPTLPPGAPSKACPVPPFSPRYLTDTCCGKVLWPGRAHQPCCGNIAYDSAVDGCCQGVLAPGYGRLPAYSCCGVVAYDPSSSICCDGRVYDSVTHGCCAGVPYSLCSQMCCDCYSLASKRGLGPRPACCGPAAYDATTHLCCDGSLYDVRGLTAARCCGSQLVHSQSYVHCCRGVPYGNSGPFSPLCCPDGSIDFCCTDPVYNATYCV